METANKKLSGEYKRRYDQIYSKLIANSKKQKCWEDRWINKFMHLTQPERAELLRKLSSKYSSEEYKKRCLKTKHYINYPLYSLLYEYCLRYCVSVYPHSRNGLIMDYDDKAYLIDEKFIFNVHETYDNVLVYTLCEIGDNEIIPLNIRDNDCTIVNPDGYTMCTINDMLIFDDIRRQIARKKVEGYKVLFEGQVYPINPDGSITDWPKGLFDKCTKIAAEILKERFK